MKEKIIYILVLCFLIYIIKKFKDKLYICKRAKKEEEFTGISECAYQVYGKSYPYTYIYDPRKVQSMNEEKKLISLIVKNKGIVIGHVALNRKEMIKHVCEISTAFVNPQFRGKGLLNKLSRKALKSSKKYGFKVAYVEAVCTHVYSQKGAKKLGLNECAIMLNKVQPLNFKKLDEKRNKRETLVRCYAYSEKPRSKKFFLEEKHREIIRFIYNNLGVKVDFYNDCGNKKVHNLKSTIKVRYSEGGSATINVLKVGLDIYNVVISKLKELLKNGTSTVLMTMNLNDRSTFDICEQFENNGFTFCGVEPRYLNEDLIILQYVTQEVNFQYINLFSHEGNVLLNYVKNEFYRNSERKKVNEF